MLNVTVLTSHLLEGTLPAIPGRVLVRRPPRDRSLREAYDLETAGLLLQSGADVVVLAGYLYIITRPLLRAFPDRILNVHDGSPKYPGLHATRDAILAGEQETYSIVRLVTPDLDRGPLLVQSHPFPVAPFVHWAVIDGEMDIVRAYAYAHRAWMMRSAWAALVSRALAKVSGERRNGVFMPAREEEVCA